MVQTNVSQHQGVIEVPSLRFQQNGQNMYLCVLPARVLIACSNADTWDHARPFTDDLAGLLSQGYQRKTITSHYRKVARYLTAEPKALLPTAVVLNVRQALEFKPAEDNGSLGLLTIPPGRTLWQVDGQHRIQGLLHAISEMAQDRLAEFPVPTVIVENMPKDGEIRHFYIVNSTQKRVRTDLAERLLLTLARADPTVEQDLIQRKRDWKLRAVKIADVMNDQPGPWQGRIRRPNAPRVPAAVASEASFTTSLKPVLTSDSTEGHSDQRMITFLADYWGALQELLPEAFAEPDQYVIQKTPGMYTLHMVAPYVFAQCNADHDHSQAHIKEILNRDSDHFGDPNFWASGGEGAAMHTGMGAFNSLAREIRALIRPSG